MQDNRAIRDFLKRWLSDDVARVLAKGASAAFVVNLLAALVGFATHVALANVLGVRRFGDYVYVIGWVNVLTVFTLVGQDTTAIRFIPIYLVEGAHSLLRGLISRSRWTVALTSALVATLLALGAQLLVERIGAALAGTFLVGAVLLVLLSLLRLSAAQLQATKRVARANTPIFVARPALIAVGVLLLHAATGFVSSSVAMVVNAIATLLALIATWVFIHQALPTEVRSATTTVDSRRWFRVMASFVFYSGFLYLMSRVDILMVGALAGTRAAGLYSVAAQVVTLVVFGLHAVLTIASPILSELHETANEVQLRRVLRQASAVSFGVAILGVLGLVFLGRFVLGIFGPEFPNAYLALCILCIGSLGYATVGLGNVVMNMTNHHKASAMIAGGALLLNIVLNALLIPRYGIDGAATATTVATVLSNVAVLLYVARRMGYNPSFLPLERIRRSRS